MASYATCPKTTTCSDQGIRTEGRGGAAAGGPEWVIRPLIVAEEGEEEEQQQRHELHQLRVPGVPAPAPTRLLLLPSAPARVVVVHITPPVHVHAAARRHAEEHVKDVLRVHLTLPMVASPAPLPRLLHLRAVRPVPARATRSEISPSSCSTS